jgi:hypothetical protein
MLHASKQDNETQTIEANDCSVNGDPPPRSHPTSHSVAASGWCNQLESRLAREKVRVTEHFEENFGSSDGVARPTEYLSCSVGGEFYSRGFLLRDRLPLVSIRFTRRRLFAFLAIVGLALTPVVGENVEATANGPAPR